MNRQMMMLAAALVCGTGFAAERKPMALLAFFDGGRADCLRNAKCPALRSLIDGTWAAGYNCAWTDAGRTLDEVDTLSYANHFSIHSGVPASVHHLRHNSWIKDPKRFVPQRSWMRVLADHGFRAAAFHSDGADSIECRDEKVKVVECGVSWPDGDKVNLGNVLEAIHSPDTPEALEFWLENPDSMGHFYGYYPSSRQYLEAFGLVDSYLGEVLKAIRERPTFDEEDWMIAFITDHGGKGVRHGPHSGHEETIPVLFASRHVRHGLIAGTVRNVDVAPTLLAHFGVAPEPQMTGQVRGQVLSPCQPAATLDERLFFRTSFDGPYPQLAVSLMHTAAKFNGPTMTVSGYAEENIRVADGYGMIDSRENPCSFWTQKTAEVFGGPFTVSWWMLDVGDTYRDNPPVVSNRNNHDDVIPETGSPAGGFTVWLESPTAPGGRGITLEYLGGDNELHSLGAWQRCVGKWTFYAVVCRGDGVIMFYQGRPDGKLNWIAQEASGAKLKGMNLVLGQDGTAEHFVGFHGGFDELSIWSRPLATTEIDEVFRKGR